MKYLKHDTSTRADSRVTRICDRYGVSGYGLLMLVTEEAAKDNSVKTIEDWSLLAKLSKGKIKEMVDFFEAVGLVQAQYDENVLKISIPGIESLEAA